MSVVERLMKYQDIKYRDFQSNLVPNINKDTIIGVRTPDMRNIAKELFNTDEANEFLNTLPHQYYEENLVHFFLIAMIKDFDLCVEAVERFLPYIDCWPVCDQSSPKVFKKNHQKIIPIIKKWIDSNHLYTSRYGIRILMNEFLDQDFNKEYLKWVSNVKSDEYYLNMMIAWYFATALAKQYDDTIVYFENKKLDPWVCKKAIQKAIESYRVSEEHKNHLRELR